ncbi:MAG: twin-arginine translocation signal domain-containing protein [Clostridia bacterium]|nr:twin-arginine translocation signal domain-containing protein [Clostridia bacterium]
MGELTRRQFLTRGIASGLAGAAILSGSGESG